MQVFIKHYLDCRSRVLDGDRDACPVKLRVTHNKKTKYFPIVKRSGEQLKLTRQEYEDAKAAGSRSKAAELKYFLDRQVIEARKIVTKLDVFDFLLFERAWTGNLAGQSISKDLRAMAAEKGTSTKRVYLHALQSLETFLGTKEVEYSAINPATIDDYVKHLERSGRAPDTIKTYMRAIIAAVNRGKERGELPDTYNPFRAYKAPTGKKRQQALTVNQYRAVEEYRSDDYMKQFARDVFTFCTLCNGQYTATVFRLRRSDIKGGWIHFTRQKTKTELRAYITDTMQEIIDRYEKQAGDYIFPVLSGKSEKEHFQTVFSRRGYVNRKLKEVAAEIRATSPLLHLPDFTVKYCRGTYLRIAVEVGGLSYEQASRAAGHSSTKMSEHYYDGQNLDAIRAAAEKFG